MNSATTQSSSCPGGTTRAYLHAHSPCSSCLSMISSTSAKKRGSHSNMTFFLLFCSSGNGFWGLYIQGRCLPLNFIFSPPWMFLKGSSPASNFCLNIDIGVSFPSFLFHISSPPFNFAFMMCSFQPATPLPYSPIPNIKANYSTCLCWKLLQAHQLDSSSRIF